MRLEFSKLSLVNKDLKCHLTWLSVRGSHLIVALYWNKGELLEPGVMFNRFLTAVTGQMGLALRDGILRIFTDLLSCMVLVYLTIICSPGFAKIMLVLAK